MEPHRTEPPTPAAAAPAGGAAARYSTLWDAGRPDLDEFLRAAGPLAADELAAVLRADQRCRWEAGERAPAEGYLRRLPGDPPDPEAALDLVFQEFLLRERLGERPDPAEFLDRFPRYADALRDQIEFHRALGTRSGDTADYVRTGPTGDDRATRTGEGADLPRSFGRYPTLRPIGRGGMGTVSLARDPLLDRDVALKVPRFGPDDPPAAFERFRREARAAAG